MMKLGSLAYGGMLVQVVKSGYQTGYHGTSTTKIQVNKGKSGEE